MVTVGSSMLHLEAWHALENRKNEDCRKCDTANSCPTKLLHVLAGANWHHRMHCFSPLQWWYGLWEGTTYQTNINIECQHMYLPQKHAYISSLNVSKSRMQNENQCHEGGQPAYTYNISPNMLQTHSLHIIAVVVVVGGEENEKTKNKGQTREFQ